MKQPCKDCVDRKVGCHGTCEKYKTWSISENEKHKKERAARERAYGYFGSKHS